MYAAKWKMNNIGLVLVSPLVRCRRLDSQITICDSESDRDVAYAYERVLAHAVVRPMRKTAPCSLGAPVNEQASSSSSSSPVHTGCLRLPRHSTTAAPRFYVLLFLITLFGMAVAVGTRRRPPTSPRPYCSRFQQDMFRHVLQ